MATIPESIKALAEEGPAEDFVQHLLKQYITDIPVITQIARDQEFPVILVRSLPVFTDFSIDERFMTGMHVAVHVFTEDPDGDQVASIISMGAKGALMKAAKEKYKHPTLGWLSKVETTADPRRVSDWATASGPVQFADLPSNAWRYEGRYRLVVRKPRTLPFASS